MQGEHIELGQDGGGWRDYLEGKQIHPLHIPMY